MCPAQHRGNSLSHCCCRHYHDFPSRCCTTLNPAMSITSEKVKSFHRLPHHSGMVIRYFSLKIRIQERAGTPFPGDLKPRERSSWPPTSFSMSGLCVRGKPTQAKVTLQLWASVQGPNRNVSKDPFRSLWTKTHVCSSQSRGLWPQKGAGPSSIWRWGNWDQITGSRLVVDLRLDVKFFMPSLLYHTAVFKWGWIICHRFLCFLVKCFCYFFKSMLEALWEQELSSGQHLLTSDFVQGAFLALGPQKYRWCGLWPEGPPVFTWIPCRRLGEWQVAVQSNLS